MTEHGSTRRALAPLLLLAQLAWLAPAGICPHAESRVESEPTCHEAPRSATLTVVLDGPGECMECHVPGCSSPSGCAAGAMATAELETVPLLPPPAQPAHGHSPHRHAGHLAPPLPPPPRV